MKDVNILKSNGINVDASLELFGDMALYDETLNDFLAEAKDRLEKTKMYKEAGDMPNYAIFAHSLKSGARYLGMENLAEMALNHEMESKAGNVTFVNQHYDELVAETNKMVALVKQYLGIAGATSGPAAPVQPEIPQSAGSVLLEQNAAVVNKCVLVADDSPLIGNFVKNVIGNGFEVLIALDGKQAIDIISTLPDNKKIIGMFLDLSMPNVDGFQVLEYFNQNGLFGKIPVMIISGHDTKDVVDRAFKYPIMDMLAKPFTEKDVKDKLEKFLK